MADREKMIKALIDAKTRTEEEGIGFIHVSHEVVDLIVELLKEQDTKTRRTYCSVCSKSAPFIYISDDYYGGRSKQNGRSVKWK